MRAWGLLVFCLLAVPPGAQAAAPTGTDRAALEALYDATDGDNWTNKTNWNTDTGDWDRVTTGSDGRVTELRLFSNNLSGTIPPELGDLTELTDLFLSGNLLSGEIPAALGNLTKLTLLQFGMNNLSGPIPEELGNLTALTDLQLWRNQLSGPIPEELGNLTALFNLYLDRNDLSGSIPPELGDLAALQFLRLYSNNLSGPIPPELGDLAALASLELQYNQLSGPIPPELGNLAALSSLLLHDNQLSGSIPPELGALAKLSRLLLNDNNLSGSIPPELGNLAKLFFLGLHTNKLSGLIPPELGDLPNFYELRLHNNAWLRGPLPTSLTGTKLRELHVQNTQITVPTAVQSGLPKAIFTTGSQTSIGTIALDATNTFPVGLWSDGTTLYVSDRDAAKVFAYTLPDGQRDAPQDIELAVDNRDVGGLWSSDEETLWVADSRDHKLYAYTLATRSYDMGKDVMLPATFPLDLWSDEETRWVFDAARNVYAYTLSDGSPDTAKNFRVIFPNAPHLDDGPGGLWSNGTTMYVADAEDARLYAYTLADGSHDSENYRVLDPANTFPGGLWSDGTTLYVADAEDGLVYLYMNRAPEAVGTLPDQTLAVISLSEVPLTNAFQDPDGDTLTYRATALDPRIAIVPPRGPGAPVVAVISRAAGTTTITVTATDPDGLTATQTFEVTVVDVAAGAELANRAPQAVGGLPAVEVPVEDVALPVPVTDAFRDPDRDTLTYSVVSSNQGIATVTVSGAVVTVDPDTAGTTTLTVTATDPAGLTATQQFTVTVHDPSVTPVTPVTPPVTPVTPPVTPVTPPVTPVTPPVTRPPGGGGSSQDRRGYLENPGPNSFQSGIGVISGWVCDAEAVVIELNGEPQPAAYGTERLDTEAECGDTDNGFGLLFNWNLLGDGEHEVVAYVDGIELSRATVTVTTLGAEFVRGVTGECTVGDFPSPAETVTLTWQQTSQNFVITGEAAPSGENHAGTAGVGYLENPGPHSFQSGIGVISGWVCEADLVEIVIDDLPPQVAGYGTERLDTETQCGDTDNGFGLLFNWNLLGDGEHTVVARVDGVELGRATVRVTTLGQEFLRGAEGECVTEDFPMAGETVTLEWQQNSQNFVITDLE